MGMVHGRLSEELNRIVGEVAVLILVYQVLSPFLSTRFWSHIFINYMLFRQMLQCVHDELLEVINS